MPKDESLDLDGFQLFSHYSRFDVADAGKVNRPKQARDWSGIVQFNNCVVLFVTLDKTGFAEQNQYYDVFEDAGATFYWDSQSRNTQRTPSITRIIQGDSVLLFARVAGKISGRTQPFTYIGTLRTVSYTGEKPVQFKFKVQNSTLPVPDHVSEIYEWRPEGARKLRAIEVKPNSGAASRLDNQQGKFSQGRTSDAARNRAVKLRAMEVAVAHYEIAAYEVEDTSENRPYDLLCQRGNEVRRVEVKGSTQGYGSVNVTAGEVKSARSEDSISDLFICYNIDLFQDAGKYVAIGGEVKLVPNWAAEEHRLVPTSYIYIVE